MPLSPHYCRFQPPSEGEPAGSTSVRHIIFLAPGQCLLSSSSGAVGLGQAVCDAGPWHPSTDATFDMIIEDITAWHKPSLVRNFTECLKCHVFKKKKPKKFIFIQWKIKLIGADKRVEAKGLILCIAHGHWLSPFHL